MTDDPTSANSEESDDAVLQEVKSDLLKVSDDLDRTNAAAEDALESFRRADRNRLQREIDDRQS